VNTVRPLLAAACLAIWPGHSEVLDFETVNGLVPIEGMSISNQFQAQFGMSFRREDGGFPVIGRKGVPRSSFIVVTPDRELYDELHPDDPRAADFGDCFLTDDGVVGGTKRIIIDFSVPVGAVSGYVFDVDGRERLTVIAYQDDGVTELQRSVVESGESDTGNGRSTRWSIARGQKDIRQIRLRETGPSTSANLGFDSIESDFTPEPAHEATLGLVLYPGLTVVGEIGRRYRIDFADRLASDPLAEANWQPLTNIFLATSPYLFLDLSPRNTGARFYRAVGNP